MMSSGAAMCSRFFRSTFGLDLRLSFLLAKKPLRCGIERRLTTASTTDQPKTNESSSPPNMQDLPPGLNATNGDVAPPPEVAAREKELLDKNEKLLQTINEIDDKYKRALAENENIRRRMRKEIEDSKQFGIQKFVKDLVEVADVLSKATEHVPKDAITDSNPHLKNLFEGLQMTEAQLQSVFRRHGVTQVNPLGEKFDPNIHEAMFEQEDPSKEPGTIGFVTKVGYRLHERTVRPALVGIIKAPKS